MIRIKETKNCDTRTLKKGQRLDGKKVEEDTRRHIEAVEACGEFLADRIKSQFGEHDHTKLGEHLPAFVEALSTGFKGKEFKGQDWWKVHLTERHHLNDEVPEDVNLIDVLEMVCDCVVAGMARTGKAEEVTLPDEVLKKAFANTAKLIESQIEVEKPDGEKERVLSDMFKVKD